jgi:ferredoxin
MMPKLVPACQHEVQKDMVVTTWCGGAAGDPSEQYAGEVAKSVRLLTELLVADHHHPDPARDDRFVNELETVATRLGIAEARSGIRRNEGRNAPHGPKSRPLPMTDDPHPYSARTIVVDHDRCILCDRCARSCSEVKPFKIIGHTGKGYGTRISFDLDEIMNESNCVQCGECMTACPTGALTLKRRVAPKAFPDAPPIPEDPTRPLPAGAGFLTAEEMVALELTAPNGKPFAPFRSIPFSYLKWNEGAVRLRRVKRGDVLCRQGEYGSTAFLLKSGDFEIWSTAATDKVERTGVYGGFVGADRSRGLGTLIAEIDSSALILGELAVLSHRPRAASIVAGSTGEVYEVTRNVLDMAQRSPAARDVLATPFRAACAAANCSPASATNSASRSRSS